MCGAASCWAWCALLFITVASVLDTVGVFTNSWMMYKASGITTKIGLWNSQACSSTTCNYVTTPDSFKNSNFRGTQAMEVIAFILFLVAPIGVSLFVCCINLRTRRKACYCMILCFVCGNFRGTQAMEVIAFILFLIAPVAVSLFVCCINLRTRRKACYCMILCFLCAFFVTVGMIIWLVYIFTPYSVGYSFGLTTLAGIFAVIAGLCLIPEIENDDDDDYDYYDRRSRRSVSPDYHRDSRPRPLSPKYPARTPRSDSSLHRAGTPIPARSVTRQAVTSSPGPVTYNSMPAAMTPDPSDTMQSTKGFRPATFNDISNITLQRDRAIY